MLKTCGTMRPAKWKIIIEQFPMRNLIRNLKNGSHTPIQTGERGGLNNAYWNTINYYYIGRVIFYVGGNAYNGG